MLPAKGRDARIMDLSPDNPSLREQRSQLGPMVCRLGQERERRRLEPGVDLIERAREGRRRRIDAGMGDDGEKLMNAWPGN